MTEAWDPGWRATLDNEETRLFIVDHALMGVAVPPGVHTLRLVYDPHGLWRAGALMIAAVLALSLLLLGGVLRALRAGRAGPGPAALLTPAS